MLMKIAIICPQTPREKTAGIENYAVNLSWRLKKLGYFPEIVTTAKNPQAGIKINDVPVAEFSRWAPGEAYFFSFGVYDYLKKSNVDIVHAAGYNSLTTLIAMIAKKRNQKLVIALQSSGPSSAFRRLMWIPYTLLFRLLSKKVDHFICASHFEKNLFAGKLKIPENRFTVIPNGVDAEAIDKIKAVQKSGQIISIGRMVKNKGFHHLLRAFKLVAGQRPMARLILVGSGPYEGEIKKLAKNLLLEKSITFIPSIHQNQKEKLLQLLKSSVLFVLLSKYEGQGIIVSESIMAGIPTLVRYSSALAEFVDQNRAIGVQNPESAEETAKKILDALDAPEKFRPNRKNILTLDQMTQKTIQVYRALA